MTGRNECNIVSRNLKACLKNCFPSQPVIHLTVIYYDNKFLLDNNKKEILGYKENSQSVVGPRYHELTFFY